MAKMRKGGRVGKVVTFAAIAGAVAAGISYFTKYKSFHKELEADFHDFEDDGDVSDIDSTMNRNYVALHADKDELKVAASDMAGAAKDVADAAKNIVKDAASIVADTARDAATLMSDTAKETVSSMAGHAKEDPDASDHMDMTDPDRKEAAPDAACGMADAAVQKAADLTESLDDMLNDGADAVSKETKDASDLFKDHFEGSESTTITEDDDE